jgi:non-heme chloroperoxidase
MIERLTVNEVTVRAVRPSAATRPPVLLIHGLLADATVFENFLPFFAERGHPTYAVNLRGRAGSRPGTEVGSASMTDFVEDASVVSERLADTAGRPLVIGHSLGGLVAQKLAELHSDRLAGVVLVCPAPPRGIPLVTFRLLAAQAPRLPALLFSRPVRARFEEARRLMFNQIPAPRHRALYERLVPDSGRAGREIVLGQVAVDERRITCPMLVIAAEDDQFIPQRVVARIARKYSAPLHLARSHGHFVPLEPGWEGVARDIARWFTETVAEGSAA